ncbi:hypothetical protein V12B01_13115 [Vibrio splendidus 12B01]|nr:hypothetical protein V12B01_13115 [Vibrio splendidus 12B01]
MFKTVVRANQIQILTRQLQLRVL